MKDDELNDIFLGMVTELETELEALDYSEEDISKWPLERLVERLAEIDQQLIRERKLLTNDVEQVHRDLHSERSAIVIALRNGGYIG